MAWYKYLAAILLIPCMTGCSGEYNYHYRNNLVERSVPVDNPWAEKRAAEEAAWARIEKISPLECGQSASPPERERAVPLSQCVSRLVETYVLPISAFPEIIPPSRAEALRIANAYAKGKLSPPEYRQLSAERVKKYKNTWARLAADRQALNDAKRHWLGDM